MMLKGVVSSSSVMWRRRRREGGIVLVVPVPEVGQVIRVHHISLSLSASAHEAGKRCALLYMCAAFPRVCSAKNANTHTPRVELGLDTLNVFFSFFFSPVIKS